MQTVAAIRYVTNGTYMNVIREYEEIEVPEAYKSIKARIHAMADTCEAAVNKVKEAGNQNYHDLVARNLYEMTADVVMSLLLLRDTVEAPELFEKSLKVYVNLAEAEIAKHAAIVNNTNVEDIENYVQVAAKAEEE